MFQPLWAFIRARSINLKTHIAMARRVVAASIALSSDSRSDPRETSPGRVYTYTEADSVKDVLQQLVFGPGLACPALGSLPPDR